MNDIVNTLKFSDQNFPQCLKNIPSPPPQIYWRGVDPNEWLDRPKVAIVGSRRMTPYGQAITNKLATQLAEAGVVIISGLAFGIDVTAHKAALAVQGTTVAVLASSLDNITPKSNYYVGRQIIQSGTLISERPQGSPVHPGLFVIRNRIISGLADIILIPEAILKSGCLHTARFALEQGKTVMAVPGNITSLSSEGSNNLIKSGAIPVTSVNDVFFALKIQPAKNKPATAFTGTADEKIIMSLLAKGIADQESLAQAAGMDGATLASALTMLELSGHIRPVGAGNWSLTH